MEFGHLHTHTTYSPLDGFGTPEQYLERMKELGQKFLAITDHGNLYGHYPFQRAFAGSGIKIIYGCELYVDPGWALDTKQKYFHVTVLAKNAQGYAELLHCANAAEQNFYRRPLVLLSDLGKLKNCVVLSGCAGDSPLLEENRHNVEYYIQVCLNRNWYIEMQPLSLFSQSWERILEVVNKYGLQQRVVFTFDVHYPSKSYEKLQNTLVQSRIKDKESDIANMKDLYLCNEEEAKNRLVSLRCPSRIIEFGLQNIDSIYQQCEQYKLPVAQNIVTDYADHIYTECLCAIQNKQLGTEYQDRLDYEWGIIREKGFQHYFAIVWQLVEEIRRRGIRIGVGRGSAGGSLMCYLLGITSIDPIQYNLSFERFINPARADFPDVDIDVESERREECVEILKAQYPSVSGIITFSQYQPRSLVKDIGRVQGKSFQEMNAITKNIVDELPSDYAFAVPMLQQYRQVGKHASGYVIANEPLQHIGVIDHHGRFSIDIHHLQDANLLKIDLLGIDCLNTGDLLYPASYDDRKVYINVFQQGNFIGIFQFDGYTVQKVSNALHPMNLETLALCVTLARPGFYHTGMLRSYATGIRNNIPEKAMSLLKDTQGYIIYQEQVMQLCRELAGFEWGLVDKIRKGVGKKTGIEMYRQAFIEGCRTGSGMNEEDAQRIWEQIVLHGGYSFNKSHAYAYAMMAYLTAYNKLYNSKNLYRNLLKNEKCPYKIQCAIYEAKKFGVSISIDIPNDFLSYNNVKGWRKNAGMTAGNKSKLEAFNKYMHLGTLYEVVWYSDQDNYHLLKDHRGLLYKFSPQQPFETGTILYNDLSHWEIIS